MLVHRLQQRGANSVAALGRRCSAQLFSQLRPPPGYQVQRTPLLLQHTRQRHAPHAINVHRRLQRNRGSVGTPLSKKFYMGLETVDSVVALQCFSPGTP